MDPVDVFRHEYDHVFGDVCLRCDECWFVREEHDEWCVASALPDVFGDVALASINHQQVVDQRSETTGVAVHNLDHLSLIIREFADESLFE